MSHPQISDNPDPFESMVDAISAYHVAKEKNEAIITIGMLKCLNEGDRGH